jgi:hypothetical protein
MISVYRQIPGPNGKKKLNDRMEDCGCQMAGIGFTIAAISYLFWIFLGPVKLSELSLAHLWYSLLTAGVGLILGKNDWIYERRSKTGHDSSGHQG